MIRDKNRNGIVVGGGRYERAIRGWSEWHTILYGGAKKGKNVCGLADPAGLPKYLGQGQACLPSASTDPHIL